MDTEELFSSPHILRGFLGILSGALALVMLECGDDVLPAVFLALLSFTAGAFVVVHLKRGFLFSAVQFFLMAVFTLVYCLDDFYEDVAECVLIVNCAAGFIITAVSVFFLLLACQKEEKEESL